MISTVGCVFPKSGADFEFSSGVYTAVTSHGLCAQAGFNTMTETAEQEAAAWAYLESAILEMNRPLEVGGWRFVPGGGGVFVGGGGGGGGGGAVVAVVLESLLQSTWLLLLW